MCILTLGRRNGRQYLFLAERSCRPRDPGRGHLVVVVTHDREDPDEDVEDVQVEGDRVVHSVVERVAHAHGAVHVVEDEPREDDQHCPVPETQPPRHDAVCHEQRMGDLAEDEDEERDEEEPSPVLHALRIDRASGTDDTGDGDGGVERPDHGLRVVECHERAGDCSGWNDHHAVANEAEQLVVGIGGDQDAGNRDGEVGDEPPQRGRHAVGHATDQCGEQEPAGDQGGQDHDVRTSRHGVLTERSSLEVERFVAKGQSDTLLEHARGCVLSLPSQ